MWSPHLNAPLYSHDIQNMLKLAHTPACHSPLTCFIGPVNHFLALSTQKPSAYASTIPTATAA